MPSEDMPEACFNGVSAGGLAAILGLSGYVRKHNPFMYCDGIRIDPSRCGHVVPLSSRLTCSKAACPMRLPVAGALQPLQRAAYRR